VKLGQMPLTLFIILAAALVYLHLAGQGRQNAQQAPSRDRGGPLAPGTVLIPPAGSGLPNLRILPGQKTKAEEYFDRYGTLKGYQGG
jgi:hypothetical protein